MYLPPPHCYLQHAQIYNTNDKALPGLVILEGKRSLENFKVVKHPISKENLSIKIPSFIKRVIEYDWHY